jgi:rhamnulokinase
MERAGIPPGLFPGLWQPRDVVGQIKRTIGAEDGGRLGNADGKPLPLVAVGSHDTAPAVAAAPADGQNFAYISFGTWSLAGMELDRPVVTEASRAANFTNEAGLDRTVRYLRNVSGLWLLQECQRHWGPAAPPVELLLRQAARNRSCGSSSTPTTRSSRRPARLGNESHKLTQDLTIGFPAERESLEPVN